MYSAILIDDEKMARTLLNGMLAEYCPQVTVLDTCSDLPSGVKSIRKHKPDIVFLDIEMPGHSGLELLDFFEEDEVNFSIIFITAYHQYAIQAFKLSAVDYLLKPIEPNDLERAVAQCIKANTRTNVATLRHNLESGGVKKLAVHTVNAISFIETNRILFLRAEGAYTHLVLSDKTKVISSRGLKNFEEMLNNHPDFFRCHKSFIVNMHHITDYIKSDGGYLLVAGNYEVAVSSEKAGQLLKKIAAL